MWFRRALLPSHAIAGVVACGSFLLLPGCHLPKLRKAEPGPALPADFGGRSTPQSSARVGIDEFFGDPVLTRTIAEALACNQELKIRNQEIRVAANEIQARRGAYLPSVGLRGEAGLDKNSRFTPLGAAEEELEYLPGKHFPDVPGNFLVAATAFWQIDIWRELRNARDAARQRYAAAVENRNFFVTTLVAEVAENYYELLALDKRLEILDQTIAIQEQSLEVAEANKEAARGTELGVQRFQAEVRKNQSEKLIVRQRIVEVENRINFLLGRYPQPVERADWDHVTLDSQVLCVGVPAQLLLNRRDVREAEREIAAAGLEVLVARARFFPRLDLSATIGYEAFDPKYLFRPEAVVANAAAGLVVPVINRKAIEADYLTANARQLQAVYDYQRVLLEAFTEVVNSLSKVENYRQSLAIKSQQLEALEASVEVASRLFQSARAEYVEVLLAQRDLLEARTVLIETKQEQLSAIVNAYQALGGGYLMNSPAGLGPLVGPPGAEAEEPDLPPLPGEAPPSSEPGKASVPPTRDEDAPPLAPAPEGPEGVAQP